MARAQLEVLLEERVPVIASGLGNPAFILEAAHARGMKVFGLVGKTRQAHKELEAGVDAVVAQGYDAPGHTGSMGTFSIVPEVVSIAGDTPVMAAGGITTGRHLAASLCLGAAGVWTGTLWLASRESDVDIIVKEKLLAASAEDTNWSKSISGMTMRVLRCRSSAAASTTWGQIRPSIQITSGVSCSFVTRRLSARTKLRRPT